MNLSQLLASRPALLRQAALANAANAYSILRDLGSRIETARLRGPVRLLPLDPAEDRFAPQLIALGGSQAMLEEHFDEADLVRLGDALAFASTGPLGGDFEFRIEQMFADYSPPLRAALIAGGVQLNDELGAAGRRG